MATYEMTTMTMNTEFAIAVTLLALLAFATITDFAQQRIPNTITLGAAVVGIGMQTAVFGMSGLVLGALGWGVGLVCFLPFYIGGGMAAGDVKLMAAAGAFLGPVGAFAACMATLVAGAVVAFGWIAWHRWWARDRAGLAEMGGSACTDTREPTFESGGKMPYAIAIAIGSALVVIPPPFLSPLLTNGGWS